MSGWYGAPGRLLAGRSRSGSAHRGLHLALATIVYAVVLVAAGLLIVQLASDRPQPAPEVTAAPAPVEPAQRASGTPPQAPNFPDVALTGTPAAPTPSDGFAPLQSQAVRDAIHRALRTGQNQRWQDGAWSGYAVPSLTTGAHGCRMVRYTVDQRPGTPYESITACE